MCQDYLIKIRKAHDKHLEKGSKKADDDKSAYKQSPADKKAKTKPSKHTNKFKQMYGEDYLNEKIKGLENKAKKSGMPYSILKKVYDRGMAAWKGGHRPGTTPQQWAFARVNSFTTKSSGTWGKADSDLGQASKRFLMPKSYKAFVKEYSMGLQVPSTSYLKGVGSLKNSNKKRIHGCWYSRNG